MSASLQCPPQADGDQPEVVVVLSRLLQRHSNKNNMLVNSNDCVQIMTGVTSGFCDIRLTMKVTAAAYEPMSTVNLHTIKPLADRLGTGHTSAS